MRAKLKYIWVCVHMSSLDIKKHQPLYSILAGICIFLAGIVIYQPVFGYNFFWEDPFDLGQVDGHSYLDLFSVPNSNSYYRPLTLVLMKLLGGDGMAHAPWPYHALNIGAHCLAAVVLFGAASRWFRDAKAAFVAAILFLLYPPAFEATSRAISPHSIVALLVIGALWLYTLGRENKCGKLLAVSFAIITVAMFFQENAVLAPFMLIALELFLWQQRRIDRYSLAVLLYLIPSVIFSLIWMSIPKPAASEFTLGLHLEQVLYLSQSISYPFARLISLAGGLGLSSLWQAILALFLTFVLFAILMGRRKTLPILLLVLVWWLIACSLAAITRSMDYLSVAPRLMYFPSLAAALGWASLILGKSRSRPVVGIGLSSLLVLALVIQSIGSLEKEIQLYQQGSRLMDQIVVEGKKGGKQLYVNVPDRFEYCSALYPIGYWGMLLAPVSQDLSDFVHFASGVQMQTKSLSDFVMDDAMIKATPYCVNTRGSNAYASDALYDSVLWADKTYLTIYHPDGSLTLALVGSISAASSSEAPIGRVGNIAEVLGGTVELRAGSVIVSVRWRSQRAAGPSDTLFVHILDANGKLVAQEDGNSLGGLIFPSAWRSGNEVLDRRSIMLTAPLPPGTYRVTTGMYDRSTGQRYPAFGAAGAFIADGELEVTKLVVR